MIEKEIEDKRKEIHTDAYPMSIGEIINLYSDDDLDIHPEFQRVYRWSEIQKSRLIESILLGIPLPSFFVSQREDGIWDVVDGLQRLSTIFSFLGIYKDENKELLPPLRLTGTEYLPSLEGKFWSEEFDPENHFSKDLQRAFKREKIDLKIIKKESDENTKYELFQRLNTFGSSLSDQEVRNCLLIMIDKPFYEWIKNLAENADFLGTIPLTSKQIDEQYPLELVLRFFVFKNSQVEEVRGLADVGDFLTKKMKIFAKADSFNRENEAAIFLNTFTFLNKVLGENSFKKYSGGKYTGAFSLSIFEVIAIGLGKQIENYNAENPEHVSKLKQVSESLQENEIYSRNSGSGAKASSRMPHILPLGEALLKL